MLCVTQSHKKQLEARDAEKSCFLLHLWIEPSSCTAVLQALSLNAQ